MKDGQDLPAVPRDSLVNTRTLGTLNACRVEGLSLDHYLQADRTVQAKIAWKEMSTVFPGFCQRYVSARRG